MCRRKGNAWAWEYVIKEVNGIRTLGTRHYIITVIEEKSNSELVIKAARDGKPSYVHQRQTFAAEPSRDREPGGRKTWEKEITFRTSSASVRAFQGNLRFSAIRSFIPTFLSKVSPNLLVWNAGSQKRIRGVNFGGKKHVMKRGMRKEVFLGEE